MTDTLTASVSMSINAPVGQVWQALTNPAMIKQYMFGTEAISDWKQGSDIRYRGQWQGKTYEDKGEIIEIIPEKKLHTTYWSSMGGKEDKPENYNHVIYELNEHEGHTLLTVSQDNIKNEAELAHMNENWTHVLDEIKKLLER